MAKLNSTRRDFLFQSAAASTVTALFASRTGLARTMPSIGIQMYMVNQLMTDDPQGTLNKLASVGYREIEAFGFAIRDAKEFRKRIDSTGMDCFSGHFSFGFVDTGKVLDDASSLGVRYAISSMLPPHQLANNGMDGLLALVNNLTRDDFKRMAQFGNEIGERARKQGLKYAYHNHCFEFRNYGGGETGYSILLKETDPELVEFEPDVGWMAAGGAHPVELLKSMRGRYHLIHLKDFSVLDPPVTKLGTDRQEKIVELGNGQVPLKAVVEYGKSQGIEHFVVDQDPPFHDKTALDAARIDYDFTAGLLAG